MFDGIAAPPACRASSCWALCRFTPPRLVPTEEVPRRLIEEVLLRHSLMSSSLERPSLTFSIAGGVVVRVVDNAAFAEPGMAMVVVVVALGEVMVWADGGMVVPAEPGVAVKEGTVVAAEAFLKDGEANELRITPIWLESCAKRAS